MNGWEALTVMSISFLFIGLLQNIFVSGPQRRRKEKAAVAYQQSVYDNQRQARYQIQPTVMIGPDGSKHPTWCPDCENKF